MDLRVVLTCWTDVAIIFSIRSSPKSGVGTAGKCWKLWKIKLGWMSLHLRKVGIQPVRRTYTYLAHLEDLGLVIRGWDADDKLHFQITARGLERLEWLRLQNGATTLEDLITPFLR